MKLLLMHQTVAAHDAIGNDIAYMAALFSGRCEAVVYCEFQKKEGYSYIDRAEALRILKDPENIVIYHHSGYWEDGEKMLLEAQNEGAGDKDGMAGGGKTEKKQIPARLVIRYHNVTPPEFFADYSSFYFQSCTKGRRQTERFCEVFPEAWWLCASDYNSTDITRVPKSRKKRLHPFHNLTAWKNVRPDSVLLDKLQQEEKIKVLFTGRVVPNKGHLELVEMLEDFRENYGDRMIIYIIGKFDGSVGFYTEELKRKILIANLEKRVQFIGEVTDEKLLAYYKGCDYYVSFSRHEGFGVPFIEAQYLGLPVIARAAGAAREVLGEGALLFENEVSHYSAAIAYLEEHPEIRRELIQAGRENCISRYDNETAGKELLGWLGIGEKDG